METPNYSIKPSLARIFIPRTINLIILAALFYLGIRINFIVFNKNFPSMINTITLAAITTLIIADILITNIKNKDSKIYFFNDRIETRGKQPGTINLARISNTEVKKNIYDKMLKTGNITLSNGQSIENIRYPERVNQYITQLIRRPPQIKI